MSTLLGRISTKYLNARLQTWQRAFVSSSTVRLPNCAVVLSGCGVYDGAEVQESTAVLFTLSKRANVQCFAPNIDQMHVVNHLNGEEMKEKRNVLVESARICRGNIKDVKELNSDDYDCVLFPGGFGAAKNLCSFAVDGADMRINGEIERVVKEFRSKEKPMGFSCIAPVIPAKLFPKCAVTVGSDTNTADNKWPYAETAQAITKMGATHQNRGPLQSYVDEENKMVTTPAYMYSGDPDDIFSSIKSMCDEVLKLVK